MGTAKETLGVALGLLILAARGAGRYLGPSGVGFAAGVCSALLVFLPNRPVQHPPCPNTGEGGIGGLGASTPLDLVPDKDGCRDVRYVVPLEEACWSRALRVARRNPNGFDIRFTVGGQGSYYELLLVNEAEAIMVGPRGADRGVDLSGKPFRARGNGTLTVTVEPIPVDYNLCNRLPKTPIIMRTR